MAKVGIFSHIDLDGLGSYKILEEVFGKSAIFSAFINYPYSKQTLNKIKWLIANQNENINGVFFTDLSFRSYDREFLLAIKNALPKNCTMTLVDHHDSTDIDSLKDIFTDICFDNSNEEHAGCGLVYKAFGSYINTTPERRAEIEEFNKIADNYDLWKKNDYWERGLQIDDLHRLFRLEDIKNWTYTMLSHPEKDNVLKALLGSLDGKKKYALKQIKQHKVTKEFKLNGKKYTISAFYSNHFINYLCHYLEDDVTFCINPVTLTTSLRSKNQDLEVHKFAETVQGGGHKQAAGAKFGEEYSYNAEKIIQHYIDFIGGVIK